MSRFEIYNEFYLSSATKKLARKCKKRILLYGATIEGLKLAQKLSKEDINIYGFVDDKYEDYDRNWMGYYVISFGEYLENFGTYYLIVFNNEDLKRALVKNEMLESENYGVINKTLFYRAFEKANILYGARKGYRIYKKLRKDNPDTTLLVCPYPGTGDAFITGRYIQQYIEKENFKTYQIITAGGGFTKILNLFGIEKHVITTLNVRKINNLKNYIAYATPEKIGVRFLLYWGISGQKTSLFEGYKGFSFDELFKKCVFQLDSGTIPYQMKQSISYKEAVEKLNKIGLPEKKTVVLAPYANSFENELSPEWWEKLSDRLKTKGYTVVTNCSGTEKPINGTKAVLFNYDELNVLMDACGLFIGMRSGLCDILSESNCKKVVIYQNFITQNRMDFFSLKHLRENQDLIEYKNDGNAGLLQEKVLKAV